MLNILQRSPSKARTASIVFSIDNTAKVVECSSAELCKYFCWKAWVLIDLTLFTVIECQRRNVFADDHGKGDGMGEAWTCYSRYIVCKLSIPSFV